MRYGELTLVCDDRLWTETDLNQTLKIYNFVIALIYMYKAKWNINNVICDNVI